jgi:hypothetical protein
VSFLAPMIRAIVRGVFDHSNAYCAQLACAPQRDSRFALMPRGRELAPIGEAEWNVREFQLEPSRFLEFF